MKPCYDERNARTYDLSFSRIGVRGEKKDERGTLVKIS